MAVATRDHDRRVARRASLVDAAMALFSAKGVAATSVDDIVQAAGVAKGTFYLYFETKDDAVNAVAEHLVERVARPGRGDRHHAGCTPITRLIGLGEPLGRSATSRTSGTSSTILHRPENRAIHDQTVRAGDRTARANGRLGSSAGGIEAGLFAPQDPTRPPASSSATLTGSTTSSARADDLEAGQRRSSTAFILRGLGYSGEIVR